MTASFDAYDRRRLQPTIVHVGPGVFHRAHQAVYSDDLLRAGAVDAAIWGISLRSGAVRDELAPDDFVYRVVARADGGSDDAPVAESTRAIGSLLGVTVAADDVDAALARLTDPHVTVVTITVTEHGYCAVEPGGRLDDSRPEITRDLRAPRSPHSLPGLLVEALHRRRASSIAPFTVASCDNLPTNGAAVARVVGEFAELRDPPLAGWIAANVAFPSSMVDRMVPASAEPGRAHADGPGDSTAPAIVTEPFRQWVVEDTFPGGRPDWGRVGVELVDDVGAHEQAKLRILNAAHSALAYWGMLAGHRFIWQAVADPTLSSATRELLEQEAIPTLVTPPGWDLSRYADTVLERFANRALPYTTAKVAGDGSQKLPVRLLPTIRELLDTGRPATRCAQVLAAWAATTLGPRHEAFDVRDAPLDSWLGGDAPRRAGVTPDDAIDRLSALPGFLSQRLPTHRAFGAIVAEQARALWDGDVRAALSNPSVHAASGAMP